jgi:NhaP-type Na+/H+ or K+/H+ antiporter
MTRIVRFYLLLPQLFNSGCGVHRNNLATAWQEIYSFFVLLQFVANI